MLIKLVFLEFENIGRFTSRQTIDFSNKKRLVQVDGKRLDYNGSSGAGKSTIFQANDYVLGLNSFPATQLQSRLTKAPIWAKGVYKIGPKEAIVTIERGKKEGLVITGTDPATLQPFVISGNNALAEEWIDSVIGIPRDVFKLMTHKRQKDRGFFLSLTPSASYTFMIKALGLSSWLDKIEKADLDLKATEKELISAESNESLLKNMLDGLLSSLQAKKNALDAISEPDLSQKQPLLEQKALIEAKIREEKGKLSSALEKLIPPVKIAHPERDLEATKDLEKQKKNIENNIANERKSIQDKKDDNLKEQALISAKIKDLSREISRENDLKKQISLLVGEVKKLKQGACSTCNQIWHDEKAKALILQKESELSALVESYKRLPELKKQLEKETERLSKIKEKLDFSIENAKIDGFLKQISQIDTQILEKNNEFYKKIQEIDKTNHKNEIEYTQNKANTTALLKNSIHELEKEFFQIKTKIEELSHLQAAFLREKELKTAAVFDLEKETEKLSLQFEGCKKTLLQLQTRKAIIENAKKAMKSYTMGMLEDALTEIGEEATQRLSYISNMATTTVYFDSFKEKKGKIKEEITAFVSIDGDEGVPLKSLSGGEESALSLAIDLAVVEVIERRGGVGADYFVMDEPFEGLDTNCRQNCVDLLKNFAMSKRIVLVDHTEQIKEMIEDKITVVRGENESYIETA